MDDSRADIKRQKIGWFCSYVPEELIIAAGLQPLRLQAGTDPIEKADSYLPANYCHYIKRILDSGLKNEYAEIEGMVFVNSCDGMRRLFDLWQHYLDTPFAFFLELPRNRNKMGIKYFAEQLHVLKNRLQNHFEIDITDGHLKEAISLMNRRRAEIMGLFQKQKSVPAPFSGTDLQGICRKESTGNKADENLTTALGMGSEINTTAETAPRVLVAGNSGFKPVLIRLVEKLGGSVVAFDTCDGIQHYRDPVEEDEDPYITLARRYLLRPSCPRMPNTPERITRLEHLASEYAVDGVIYSSIKFCDHSLFEVPHLEKRFNDVRIPLLFLENDYSWSDIERVKTRVEAFIEMIAGPISASVRTG